MPIVALIGALATAGATIYAAYTTSRQRQVVQQPVYYVQPEATILGFPQSTALLIGAVAVGAYLLLKK